MIRVLIADDETLFRRLLATQLSLEADLQVVGEAADGKELVKLASSARPDIVVTDLQMPHLNGAQATERIIARQPWVKVILLTALDELAILGQAAGAFECLNKDCTPADLLSAIRRAYAARGSVPEPGLPASHQAAVYRLAKRHELSERETQVVIKYLETESTIAEIADELTAETNEPVSESAVKHAMERAMTKLRTEPRTRRALIKQVLSST